MPAMQIQTTFWRWRGALRSLAMAALAIVGVIVLVSVLVLLEGRRDDLRQGTVARVGAAIVLGAQLENGAPSPAFQARLDHVFDLYRRGQVRQIILTGGITAGGSVAEAAAGRDYLLKKGLPAEALLAEEDSTSTLGNLQNALPLAQANGIQTVALVSDSTHMLRALKMARDLGFEAYGSPVPPPDSALPALGAAFSEAAKYLAYLFARR